MTIPKKRYLIVLSYIEIKYVEKALNLPNVTTWTTFSSPSYRDISPSLPLPQARDANLSGDQLSAERSSRTARTLNHVSLGIGLTILILTIIYMVVVVT